MVRLICAEREADAKRPHHIPQNGVQQYQTQAFAMACMQLAARIDGMSMDIQLALTMNFSEI